ncbi:MAG TPA: hypothetical protein VJZ27_16410 [Aggregatilineales bacterium]|nr:hypothetical protein [Aggregatilineales bacterium]
MNRQDYNPLPAVIDYLTSLPIQSEDIEPLGLPPDSIRRLRYLIEQEKQGKITRLEQIQLNAFKEVVFFRSISTKHQVG